MINVSVMKYLMRPLLKTGLVSIAMAIKDQWCVLWHISTQSWLEAEVKIYTPSCEVVTCQKQVIYKLTMHHNLVVVVAVVVVVVLVVVLVTLSYHRE